MKKLSLLSVLFVFALLLNACSAVFPFTPKPETAGETTAPTEAPSVAVETTEAPVPTEPEPAAETSEAHEPPTEPAAPESAESSAFTARFPGMDETVLGVIYNAPFNDGQPNPTEAWNDEYYDRLAIIPRYPGSKVEAFTLSYGENGYIAEQSKSPAYSTVAEDGCVISAGLTRPDVLPMWLVTITAPDGRSAAMSLDYNGRYGTPIYEFLTEDMSYEAVSQDWELQAHEFGYYAVSAFLRAAERQGLDPQEAAKACNSALTELGDTAAFTRSEGDMDSGIYHLEAARFREDYYEEMSSLAESVHSQYRSYLYSKGPQDILGPGVSTEGVELVFQLTGLTVFNPSMQATRVRVTVNHEVVGEYDLCASDMCTIIPLDLPEVRANAPITVDVEVLETSFGTPDSTILEVTCGVGGNISGAR